ncbi:nuclear GTPase SLIP-GC-like [Aegotheles albertisi]
MERRIPRKRDETVEKDLKNILNKAVEKVTQFLSEESPPGASNGMEYLKNRLLGLNSDILLDPIYIGLFGSTGAGKSTLLNAILGKKFFLPVSGSKSCTSCVVQVTTSHIRHHEAKIHLLTDEEWKDELKGLVALAEPDEGETSNERKEAVLKICTIYGEGAETKTYEELCGMRPIVQIPNSRCITLKETSEKELSKKMGPYIWIQSLRRDAQAGTTEEDRKKLVWPLIKNVEVTIPRSQEIPEGVVFVDIPGMGDFNRKRDAMWRENINKCSVIWVVNSIERIQGDKNHEVMLKEGMKAFQSGMCKDISLLVTKSDHLNIMEYQWETNNDNINKHDAILERNESVKQEKREEMMENLAKMLPSNSEVLRKPDLVYTVSAQEYWYTENLSREETEIPKLRDYIWTFYNVQKKKELMDYRNEILVIFSLIQSLLSNQVAENQSVVERDLKVPIMHNIGDLEKDVEACVKPIVQALGEGVDQAKKSYRKTTHKIISPNKSGQGYHKTLKALCQRNGLFVSPTFGRIDINECLAEPIYEKIERSFGNMFRIQMDDCCELKSYLEKFKDEKKKHLEEVMKKQQEEVMNNQLEEDMRRQQMANIQDKFKFLLQETDFIIRDIEKAIFQKKAQIYQSLAVSIQSDLLQYYEDAARQRGKEAYTRMQRILSTGIETEMNNGMFERAQESMSRHIRDLKVEIIQKMRKDFCDMLSVAFGPRYQSNRRLPDFNTELSSICEILRKLQPARDA